MTLPPIRLLLLRTLAVLVLALLGLAAAPVAEAQTPVSPPPAAEPQTPEDLYGRSTPEGAVSGFLEALRARDYERAGVYLDTDHLPRGQRAERARQLARSLQVLLDREGRVLPRTLLSRSAEGDLDDGLEPELERAGALTGGENPVDLLLRRQETEGEAVVWRIARESLNAAPALAAGSQRTPLDRWLPGPLQTTELRGAPVGHWLALLLLTVAAYLAVYIPTETYRRLYEGLQARRGRSAQRVSILGAVLKPLRLYAAVLIVFEVARPLGVGIVARDSYGRLLAVVAWFALGWLLVRLIDLGGERALAGLQRRQRAQAISVAAFVRRLLKAAVLVLGVIAVLDTVGVDVTTGLAALGIGGLALALGAQKTIENLVASVSVLADQPIRLGEFCKIGGASGHVEEIGMRSTRLRTLEQTLMIIPNSEVAANAIENFSRRRRFWLHPVFNLSQNVAPAQVEAVVEGLREALERHPRHPVSAPRVRLLSPKDDRLPIEVFAHLDADSFDEFLAIQEDLVLSLLRVLEREGAPLVQPAILAQAS